MVKIEKPWCIIFGSTGFIMGIGKVLDVGNFVHMQYSEDHEPMVWENKHLERFKSFRNMVIAWSRYCRISFKQAKQKALGAFPSQKK